MSHTYTINNTSIADDLSITGVTGVAGVASITGSSYVLNSGAGSNTPLIYTTNTTAGRLNYPQDSVMVVNTDPNALDVNGKLILNGQDLEERLNTIEKVLQIPERDVKLEKKHPKLKKLYDEYIAALGKYRTFEAIKGDNDAT